LGVSASELGALNAARANPKALENAAPNSRVGRIADYRDAVLAGRALEAELETTAALLKTLPLPNPDRPLSKIEEELKAADALVVQKAAAVTALETAVGTDPAVLAAARDELLAAETAAAKLREEQAAVTQYAAVSAKVDELTKLVEAQPEVERALLVDAANKPVTDEVEAAVQTLLGLDE
jgi:hypothetical protein